MIASYTVSQLRDSERAALARTADGVLMRQAAHAVAVTALGLLPSPLPGRRVVLLVGTGNNGGDALYAGAFLRRRGIGVIAVLTDPSAAHADGLAELRRVGGRVLPAGPDRSAARGELRRADLVIDGLVGIGARPPLRAPAAELAAALDSTGAMVLAVDVPSGIDPDTGRTDGPAIRADVTVTFGAASTGLLVAEQAGEVIVADLGLAPGPTVLPDGIAVQDSDLGLLPQPGAADDKFSGGVLGVVAGSARYPGAAVLAVGAAVRLRPGLVRYAGPQAAAVLARWPEVVAADEPDDAGRVQAWLAGPGMGTDGTALARLRFVLEQPLPAVVDADGLTLLAGCRTLLSRRTGPTESTLRTGATAPTVLTPHAGEFSRLWPDLDPTDRVASARAAAIASGAVVLLKGHRTVIAAPDGRTAVNRTGTAWLATAGSGDVLSGIISSLLAADLDPFLAAALGAHLHGLAGQRAQAAGQAGAQALLDHLVGADR